LPLEKPVAVVQGDTVSVHVEMLSIGGRDPVWSWSVSPESGSAENLVEHMQSTAYGESWLLAANEDCSHLKSGPDQSSENQLLPMLGPVKTVLQKEEEVLMRAPSTNQDEGFFGEYGGNYTAETLMPVLEELLKGFRACESDRRLTQNSDR